MDIIQNLFNLQPNTIMVVVLCQAQLQSLPLVELLDRVLEAIQGGPPLNLLTPQEMKLLRASSM